MFNTSLGDKIREQTELGRKLALEYPHMKGYEFNTIKNALSNTGGNISDLAICEMMKQLNR